MATASPFLRKFHKAPYPSIATDLPALSQAGKTVLVTGGSEGIGYAIARAFLRAGATKAVLLGRREDFVLAAAEKLAREVAPPGTSEPEVVGLRCDIAEPADIARVWQNLRDDGAFVDVVVLNAANPTPVKTVLELGVDRVWDEGFMVNVRSQIDFAERFYKQEGESAADAKTKYLVSVSTIAIHNWSLADTYPTYGLTKNSGALSLQVIAQDVAAEDMQIVSFHPGGVFTTSSKKNGWKEDSWDWDSVDLPGQFAVWAASPEAKFLHGRFAHANWDVDEMKSGEMRKHIDEDPFYLKVGVKGL